MPAQKRNRQYMPFLPVARPFSEIESDVDPYGDKDFQFDASDHGSTSEEMYKSLYSGDMLLYILSKLKREQDVVIFLLQIIRDEHRNLTYDEIAKARGLHRVRYMQELKRVKEAIRNILVDYK